MVPVEAEGDHLEQPMRHIRELHRQDKWRREMARRTGADGVRELNGFSSDPLPDVSVWTLLRGFASGVVLGFAWLVVLAAVAGFVFTVYSALNDLHL